MGSLILCSKKKAKHPYEITRIHRRIYTIEELCYYLSNNLYLVDYTIMNEQFCRFLDMELQMHELAAQLKQALLDRCSVEFFIMSIMEASGIYRASEINHIAGVLDKLKDQKEIERQKYKADNLLSSGEAEEAVLVYQMLLRKEKDDTVSDRFYGKVYASLGAAYGRLFLYEEAMEMYDKGFQICNDPAMLKAYLYAASRVLPDKEYRLFLAKSDVFEEMDKVIQQEISSVAGRMVVHPTEALFEEWKNEYRQNHLE